MSDVVSLELLFDDATEARLRDEWRVLQDLGVSSMAAHTSASNRPHVSLLVRSPAPEGAPSPPGEAFAAAVGQRSSAGPPGSVGEFGSVGQPGSVGEFGSVGQPGSVGEFGSVGPSGSAGEFGSVGRPGSGGGFGSVGRPGSGGGFGFVDQPGSRGQSDPAGEFGSASRGGSAGQRGSSVGQRASDGLNLLDVESVRDVASRLPLPLTLGGPQLFPHGTRTVLARSVVPSLGLLEFHAELHALAGATELAFDLPHTTPGNWTPHVTLARRLKLADLERALPVLDLAPLHALATELRLWDARRGTVVRLRGG